MDKPRSRTALIVDDEIGIREFLGEVLERENFEIIYAADGNKAIQILKDRPDIGLLVCDILMPGIDGLEVLIESHRLHRLNGSPKPKTILISGGGMYESGEFYLESTRLLGADITLSKPFSIKEFLAALAKLGFANGPEKDNESGRPSSNKSAHPPQ